MGNVPFRCRSFLPRIFGQFGEFLLMPDRCVVKFETRGHWNAHGYTVYEVLVYILVVHDTTCGRSGEQPIFESRHSDPVVVVVGA